MDWAFDLNRCVVEWRVDNFNIEGSRHVGFCSNFLETKVECTRKNKKKWRTSFSRVIHLLTFSDFLISATLKSRDWVIVGLSNWSRSCQGKWHLKMKRSGESGQTVDRSNCKLTSFVIIPLFWRSLGLRCQGVTRRIDVCCKLLNSSFFFTTKYCSCPMQGVPGLKIIHGKAATPLPWASGPSTLFICVI